MKPSLTSPVKSNKVHSGVGEVRIIGGQWRRTKLAVPNKPGLRPTPDRVRETLFNWLGQDLQGWRCFDAFAGTGALGLEAASRRAAQVVVCEQDASLVNQLKLHVQKLAATAVEVRRGDGLIQLEQSGAQKWDLIFLDPPFDGGLFERALRTAARVLDPKGWIYLEAPTAWSVDELKLYGLESYRYLKAGAVHAHLLRLIA